MASPPALQWSEYPLLVTSALHAICRVAYNDLVMFGQHMLLRMCSECPFLYFVSGVLFAQCSIVN